MSHKRKIRRLHLVTHKELNMRGLHIIDGLAIASVFIVLLACISFLPDGKDYVATPVAIILLVAAVPCIIPKLIHLHHTKRCSCAYFVKLDQKKIRAKMVICVLCAVFAAIALIIATFLLFFNPACHCAIVPMSAVITQAINLTYKSLCLVSFFDTSKQAKKYAAWYLT